MEVVRNPGNNWQCWGVVYKLRNIPLNRPKQCACKRRELLTNIRTCIAHKKLEEQAQALTVVSQEAP